MSKKSVELDDFTHTSIKKMAELRGMSMKEYVAKLVSIDSDRESREPIIKLEDKFNEISMRMSIVENKVHVLQTKETN